MPELFRIRMPLTVARLRAALDLVVPPDGSYDEWDDTELIVRHHAGNLIVQAPDPLPPGRIEPE